MTECLKGSTTYSERESEGSSGLSVRVNFIGVVTEIKLVSRTKNITLLDTICSPSLYKSLEETFSVRLSGVEALRLWL